MLSDGRRAETDLWSQNAVVCSHWRGAENFATRVCTCILFLAAKAKARLGPGLKNVKLKHVKAERSTKVKGAWGLPQTPSLALFYIHMGGGYPYGAEMGARRAALRLCHVVGMWPVPSRPSSLHSSRAHPREWPCPERTGKARAARVGTNDDGGASAETLTRACDGRWTGELCRRSMPSYSHFVRLAASRATTITAARMTAAPAAARPVRRSPRRRAPNRADLRGVGWR